MLSNKIILYGASGHAKVISSIIEAMDMFVDIIFDDNEKVSYLNQYRVINSYDKNYNPNIPIIISIGDNKIRKKISEKISHPFTILIHPSSVIDKNTKGKVKQPSFITIVSSLLCTIIGLKQDTLTPFSNCGWPPNTNILNGNPT